MTPEQLKASILQYAIQGKLVPQDPSEGTGEELYQQIQEEKQRLIKEGKIKKGKQLADITEDEIPFDIPESWKWVRLSQIIDVRDGTHDSPKYVSEGIPLVTSKNLSVGTIDYENIKYITQADADKINERSAVDDGDILFAMIGSIGNPVLVKKDREFCIKNMALFKRYENTELYMKYMYWFFYYIQYALKSEASGGVQSFIPLKRFREYIFPLPPLAEQHRIVAKIEELLPYVDRYAAAYEKLEQFNASFPKDMKKSVLQYAIQGKLVPQDPSEGTGEELYQQIQEEKQRLIKEGKLKKGKPLAEIAEDEVPFDIPESWKWVRVQSVVTLNPKNEIDDDVDAGFIPMTLVSDGFRNLHSFEVKKWGDIKKGFSHFADGDIGVAKITPCFQNRKSVIFRNLPNGCGAGTTELTISRVIGETLNREYLLWFFKTAYFIENGVKSFTGTAGQQRIHKDYLANCLLPLPPLAEQHRIVAKLEEILPLCDRLK